MRAIEISRPGDASVLVPCERPVPIPRVGEVLIRVEAAGVNRPDVLQRQGHYPVPADASDLPGLEVAGEIVDGDPDSAGLRLGSRVCALVHGGGYAEYACASAALCLPIPKGWSAVQAASLPEACFTVWSNVFDRGRLAEGESLLVHGGGSGIGVTAIQIARALGHRIFVTAGSETRCRACEALGAETAIDYRKEDFVKRILELTAGNGVNVILDMVGGEYIARDMACLAEDGRVVVIALLGGATAKVALGPVLMRRFTLTGSTLRPRTLEFKSGIADALRRHVWPRIDAGQFKAVIDRVYPLDQAREAHQRMEAGAHFGKIILKT